MQVVLDLRSQVLSKNNPKHEARSTRSRLTEILVFAAGILRNILSLRTIPSSNSQL